LQSIETKGDEGDRNDEDLIRTLTRLQQVGSAAQHEACDSAASSPEATETGKVIKDVEAAKQVSLPSRSRSDESKEQDHPEEALTRRQRADSGVGNVEPSGKEVSPAESVRAAVSDASIRVDVGLLDKLMTLVGELVLARNQILQVTNTREDAALLAP